jgi:nicotine oxidoreductase
MLDRAMVDSSIDTNGVMLVEREGSQVCEPEDKLGSPEMGDNILARLEALRKSNGNPNWVNRDLYRLLYKRGLFVIAYERIKSSPGNMTPGTDNATLDGFSLGTIDRITEALRTESFQFSRARRVQIPKANGGSRPLGIASPRDKLVQEAIRIILESIYDSPHGSSFSEFSFGFRAGRGTHTALQHISQNWSGTTWFVEGDIKGCFDNIDHHRLIEILKKRIDDQRFLNLIWKALTAGYLEFKVPVNNIVGTPQGSIISPILANVYMHELDVFVENLRIEYEVSGAAKKYSPDYADNQNALRRLRRKLEKTTDDEMRSDILNEIQVLKVRATTLQVFDAACLPTRIKYVRYADDWLISISGTNALAKTIRDRVGEFLSSDLKLELSKEKTHIRHAKTEEAFFLGTRISCGSKNPRILTFSRKAAGKEDILHVTKRTTVGTVKMYAPIDRIVKRLANKGMCDGDGHPLSLRALAVLEDARIIEEYNAVLRGYLNYYSFVANRARLRRIAYIVQFSAAKTLAHRHRTSMRRIFRKFGYRLTIPVDLANGEIKLVSLAYPTSFACNKKAFLTGAPPDSLDVVKIQTKWRTRSKLMSPCCICGEEEGVVMHHVRHVRKNGGAVLKGFDKIMSNINRKQLPVCLDCHEEIHSGRYDGKSLSDFADPHLAAR